MTKQRKDMTPEERLAAAQKKPQRTGKPGKATKTPKKGKGDSNQPPPSAPPPKDQTAKSPPSSSSDDKIEPGNYPGKRVISELISLSNYIEDGLEEDYQGLSDEDIAAKSPLSEREKLFLTLYFTTFDVSQSVKNAGYKAKHQQSRSLIANRILQKYCALMEDRQNFLRELGISEVSIALLIWQKAQGAKSETVQLNALKVLANMHGLLKGDADEPPATGLKIIFEGSEEDAEAPGDSHKPEETVKGRAIAIVK